MVWGFGALVRRQGSKGGCLSCRLGERRACNVHKLAMRRRGATRMSKGMRRTMQEVLRRVHMAHHPSDRCACVPPATHPAILGVNSSITQRNLCIALHSTADTAARQVVIADTSSLHSAVLGNSWQPTLPSPHTALLPRTMNPTTTGYKGLNISRSLCACVCLQRQQ